MLTYLRRVCDTQNTQVHTPHEQQCYSISCIISPCVKRMVCTVTCAATHSVSVFLINPVKQSTPLGAENSHYMQGSFTVVNIITSQLLEDVWKAHNQEVLRLL